MVTHEINFKATSAQYTIPTNKLKSLYWQICAILEQLMKTVNACNIRSMDPSQVQDTGHKLLHSVNTQFNQCTILHTVWNVSAAEVVLIQFNESW